MSCTVIDIISVCGSIRIEIPILWPCAVMVGPRPRVLLTLPLTIISMRHCKEVAQTLNISKYYASEETSSYDVFQVSEI